MKKILMALVMGFFVIGAYGQADILVRSVRFEAQSEAEMNAIPANKLQEGSVCYREDTDSLWRYDGSAWAEVSGGIADGDKGDVTVSGSGSTFTIDNGVVTEVKLNTSVNASLDLADSSVQPADLNGYLPLSGGNLNGNLLPSANNTYTLGGLTNVWSGVYGGIFYGDQFRWVTNYGGSGTNMIGDMVSASLWSLKPDINSVSENMDLSYDYTANEWTINSNRILTTADGLGDLWSDPVDSDIVPDSDGTRDLGDGVNRFSTLYIDQILLNGSQNVTANMNLTGATSHLFLNPHDTQPASTEGIIYADNSENRPKYYDGTSWRAFLLDGDAAGASLPVDDTTALVQDPSDNTKQVRIDAGAITTSTTRTITMPDANVDLGNLGPSNIDLTANYNWSGSQNYSSTAIYGTYAKIGNSSSVLDYNLRRLSSNFSIGIETGVNTDSFTEIFTIDPSGNVSGNSFVKSGATSDDVLLGDGTTTSLSGINGYPSTAQQYYIVGASAKDTITDADYASAAEYKALFYRNVDTLEVGDGVTFATHGNKPVMVQPTTKDSTYIKKADGVDFFVAGQTAAVTGDGLIVKNRNTAVGYKEGADAWYWSGDLTVHTEVTDAILGLNPDLYVNNTSIVATGTTDGDNLTEWTDLSGNGNDGVPGTAPDYFNGTTGPQVNFDGSTEWLDVADASVGDYTLGTDEFTIVVREGDNVGTTGYLVSKVISTTSDGLWGIFKSSALNYRFMHGGTTLDLNGLSASANKLIIVTFTTTDITVFVDGTQVGTTTLDTTYASNSAQSINIGSRSDGSFLYNADIDLVAVIPVAVDGTQRAAIETEFQVN